MEVVCDGLKKAGINQEKYYCGDTFHVGAAATVAAKGVEGSI